MATLKPEMDVTLSALWNVEMELLRVQKSVMTEAGNEETVAMLIASWSADMGIVKIRIVLMAT